MTESASNPLVLIVYDQPTLRESYVAAIRALTSYRTASAGCVEEALNELRSRAPDVVLLDARLPRKAGGEPSYADGRSLLTTMRKECPTAGVLVTSVVWTPYLLWFSVRQGASGVLRDDADFPEIARAIIATAAAKHYRARDDEDQLAFMEKVNVTEQDQKILLMKREGLSHQDIAEALGISRHTIRSHFQKLASRLGVDGENEGSIVYRASEIGLLQFP